MLRHMRPSSVLFAIFAVLVLATISRGLATPTTLDVSQSFSYVNSNNVQVNLPAITTGSTPAQITGKFQGLLRYFNEMGLTGTITIPAGTWQLNQTLYLTQYSPNSPLQNSQHVNLVGAGQTSTILQAAPGYEEMPVVMLGRDLQQRISTSTDLNSCGLPAPTMPNLELNALHRPQVTGVGILDSSVSGARYGWRTNSTPPGGANCGYWSSGTYYSVGSIVTCGVSGANNTQYYCTQAHTADNTVTIPYTGTNWQAYWREINVNADGLLDSTPFSAGPLDPGTNSTQATYWQNTNQFTLDVCVVNNGAGNMNGTICSVTGRQMSALTNEVGSVWSLRTDGSYVYFDIVQPAAVAHELNTTTCIESTLGSSPLGPGTHRLSVEIDFRNGEQYLAGWIDGVQQAINGHASCLLPSGTTFMPCETASCYLGRNCDPHSSSYVMQNDWTFAGLSMSNVTRYSVGAAGSTQARADAQTLTDNLRYFTNDANTIAYLTLADTPPADSDYTNPGWQLMQIQCGQASTPAGCTPALTYGYWCQEPCGDYNTGPNANGGSRIANLTILKQYNSPTGPNSVYGSPCSLYNSYGCNLTDVTLNGGLKAFNVQPHWDNEYVIRLYNVSLNASFAGFYSFYLTQVEGSGVTFPSPGKHAILTYGGIFDWRNVNIGPATYCDYLVKDLDSDQLSTVYSGMTITPDPNHTYPTAAVFYHGWADTQRNLLRIDNCSALNLPPNIVFIESPEGGLGISRVYGDIVVNNPNFSVYRNGQLATFIRAFTPYWYARISGCTQELSEYVNAWVDAGDVLPWHDNGESYGVDDLATLNGKIYRCIRPHGNGVDGPLTGQIEAHEPGVAGDWQNFWVEQEWCNIKFIHPDFTALPTTGNWVQSSHVLQIPTNPNGTTEYRCVQSGTGSAALWAPVVTEPPSVTLTGPQAGSYPTGNVTLTATASAVTGNIGYVDFYAGSTLLGTGTPMNGTYTLVWNAPNGSYAITAKAYDTHAAWTISNTANITVAGGTQVAMPTYTPIAGSYTASQTVTINTTTGGATIRYTTDGSTPSESHGTIYTTPVAITATTTLNAIAYEAGMTDSAIASGIYTIQSTTTCATPTFTPAAGSYATAQSVTISTMTGGATIRYTTDGSTPSESHGTIYTTPVAITATTTLNALAYDAGMTDSAVASASYTITGNSVPTDGMLLWLKADAITGLGNGGALNTWTDSSGNGYNAAFTQVNGVGVAPLYETNVYNGLPTVRFNGNSLLQVPSLPIGPYTIVAVFNTTASDQIVYEHSDNLNQYETPGSCFLYTSTGNTIAVARAGVVAGKDETGSTAGTWAASYNGLIATVQQFDGTNTGLQLTINGTLQSLNQTYGGSLSNTTVVTEPFNIGERASNGTLPLQGDISEVIVYNHSLSSSDMTQLNTALISKYGIGGVTTVATPTFSPAAGSYTSAQTVTISTTTNGATIRYTTDGSTPSATNGTVYNTPLGISANTTLNAIAYATGMTNSAVASGTYAIQCAAPTFNPAAGTYAAAQSVTISTTTGGATIRYTTDGSTPSESHGTIYSTPVAITATTTLNALAYDAGMTDSAVASASYTITANSVPTDGMLLWLKADAITGLGNGGALNTWTDSSGNGYNAAFTQVNGVGVAPLYETNVYNGLPTVRFNGNSLLQVPSLPIGPYTIVAVFNTTASDQIVYEHSDNLNQYETPGSCFLYTSTGNTIAVARAGVVAGKDETGSTAGTWAASYNGLIATVQQFDGTNTGLQLTINGTLQSLNQTYGGSLSNTTVVTEPFNIGERASNGTLPLQGDISEVIVYNHSLSSSDMTQLNTALISKYGIGGVTTVATPTFSPAAGTYTSAQTVTISTTTNGAAIRYTTDGSTPSATNGTVYSAPLSISANTTLNAIAYATGMTNSAVASGTYAIQCAAPAFNPTAGTYAAAQSVTISTTTGGATIRYTTDGSTPSESHGTIYSTPVAITATTTLNALAYDAGMTDSAVASASYTITANSVPTDGMLLWLKADAITGLGNGGALNTWTDSSGNGYNAAFTQVNGVGVAPLYETNVYNGLPTVRFNGNSLLQVPSLPIGPYTIVAVFNTTASDQIVYEHSDNLNQYETPGSCFLYTSTGNTIAVARAGVVAGKDETGSTAGTWAASYNGLIATVQQFDGTNTGLQLTINGTLQSLNQTYGGSLSNTTVVTEPFNIGERASNGTLPLQGDISEVIVYNHSLSSSDMTQLNTALISKYGIGGVTTVATPTFSPAAGSYTSAQTVTISTTTNGATIRYTTDGSTPSATNGTVYNTPLGISANTTLNAIAYATGMTNSAVASGTYAIQCAAPTFNPAAGAYAAAQSVTISTTTGGATMRYTTDGSTPTESHGTVYSTAVNISANTTLNAIAYQSGMTDSTVTSGSYTVQCATPTFTPAAGTYTSAQSVTISTTTNGATIRYTTDGSTPTETNGTVYSTAVNISTTTTLQAIAYMSGMADSPMASGVYTINSLPSTGMLLWLKADAITGLSNGGAVNTWNDSSGNGRNAAFTQVGGAGVAPLYETNVYNGKPVVRFNGNSLLQVSSLPLGTYSIVSVFKTTANSQIVYEHSDDLLTNSNGNFLWTSTNSTVAVKRGGAQTGKDIMGDNAGNWAASFGVPLIAVDEFGGTDASEALIINGSPQWLNQTYTGNLNTTTATAQHFNIGERAANGTLQFAGDIAEIVVYDHVLSASDLATVNTALMSKYALANAPTVSITAPTNGTVEPAQTNVTLAATAGVSGDTISKVEFYHGTTLLGSASSSPYTFTWNSPAAGSYTLSAIAYTSKNLMACSAPVTITVDTAPTVNITAPANNAQFSAPASITLTASATAANGTIAQIQFFNGSTLLGTATNGSYTWTNVPAGSYSLTAQATDSYGSVGTSSAVNVTVTSVPTTGMLLWLKADAITGLSNGGSVNTWTDSSGNGRNAAFTQVNGVGVAPLYETNVYNGLPAVRFNGNSLLQVPSLPIGPYTIVAVFNTTASDQIVYEHSDNLNQYGNPGACFLYTSTGNTIAVARAGVVAGKDETGSTAGTWAASYNGLIATVQQFDGTNTGLQLTINGVLQSLNQTYGGSLSNTTVVTEPFNIGERASNGTLPLQGDIAEIIVYDHSLSSSDMTQLNNSLLSKYGI